MAEASISYAQAPPIPQRLSRYRSQRRTQITNNNTPQILAVAPSTLAPPVPSASIDAFTNMPPILPALAFSTNIPTQETLSPAHHMSQASANGTAMSHEPTKPMEPMEPVILQANIARSMSRYASHRKAKSNLTPSIPIPTAAMAPIAKPDSIGLQELNLLVQEQSSTQTQDGTMRKTPSRTPKLEAPQQPQTQTLPALDPESGISRTPSRYRRNGMKPTPYSPSSYSGQEHEQVQEAQIAQIAVATHAKAVTVVVQSPSKSKHMRNNTAPEHVTEKFGTETRDARDVGIPSRQNTTSGCGTANSKEHHRNHSLSALEGRPRPLMKRKSTDELPPILLHQPQAQPHAQAQVQDQAQAPKRSDSKSPLKQLQLITGSVIRRNPTSSANARTDKDRKARPKHYIERTKSERKGTSSSSQSTSRPTSSNGKERYVRVSHSTAELVLPVMPETTAADLIKAASDHMMEPLDLMSTVLLEHFGKCGIRRPLRPYEKVARIMTSWDDDDQYALLLRSSNSFHTTGLARTDVDAASIPTERPSEFSCWLKHSRRPGKWSRRYITLRSDGQVLCSKHAGPHARNEKHKDVRRIAHMSDFDIYTPDSGILANKVRPPTKEARGTKEAQGGTSVECWALKSQARSSMFEDLDAFVHFFCAEDESSAQVWEEMVRGWRSWYLVHVLGDGQAQSSHTAYTTTTMPEGHLEGQAVQLHLSASASATDGGACGKENVRTTSHHNNNNSNNSKSQAPPPPPSATPKRLIDNIPVANRACPRSQSQHQQFATTGNGNAPFTAGSLLDNLTQGLTQGQGHQSNSVQRTTSQHQRERTNHPFRGRVQVPAPAAVKRISPPAGVYAAPLIDSYGPKSRFTEGSLLARREMLEGPPNRYGTVIDRHRVLGKEVRVGVGEGARR